MGRLQQIRDIEHEAYRYLMNKLEKGPIKIEWEHDEDDFAYDAPVVVDCYNPYNSEQYDMVVEEMDTYGIYGKDATYGNDAECEWNDIVLGGVSFIADYVEQLNK